MARFFSPYDYYLPALASHPEVEVEVAAPRAPRFPFSRRAATQQGYDWLADPQSFGVSAAPAPRTRTRSHRHPGPAYPVDDSAAFYDPAAPSPTSTPSTTEIDAEERAALAYLAEVRRRKAEAAAQAQARAQAEAARERERERAAREAAAALAAAQVEAARARARAAAHAQAQAQAEAARRHEAQRAAVRAQAIAHAQARAQAVARMIAQQRAQAQAQAQAQQAQAHAQARARAARQQQQQYRSAPVHPLEAFFSQLMGCGQDEASTGTPTGTQERQTPAPTAPAPAPATTTPAPAPATTERTATENEVPPIVDFVQQIFAALQGELNGSAPAGTTDKPAEEKATPTPKEAEKVDTPTSASQPVEKAADPEEPVIPAKQPSEKAQPTSTTDKQATTESSDPLLSFLDQLVPGLGATLSAAGVIPTGSAPSSSPESSKTAAAASDNRRADDVAALIDRVIPGFGFGQAFKDASAALAKEDEKVTANKTDGEQRYTAEEKGKSVDRPKSPVVERTPSPAPKDKSENDCGRCATTCAAQGKQCGQTLELPGYTVHFFTPTEDKPAESKSQEKQPEAIKEPATESIATPAAPAQPAEPTIATETYAATAPVDTPASPQSDAAANLIQQKYRKHRFRLRRLEKLDSLRAKLDKVIEEFEFPTTLDFATPSSVPSSPSLDPVDGAVYDEEHKLQVPPLAFTPVNQSYHAHAHALLQLLTAADSIPSDGDKEVRKARKDFVKLVESKLAEMEVKRSAVWKEVQDNQKIAAAESTEAAAPTPEDTPSTTESIDTVKPAENVETAKEKEPVTAPTNIQADPSETAEQVKHDDSGDKVMPALPVEEPNTRQPTAADIVATAATVASVEDDSDTESVASRHTISTTSDEEQEEKKADAKQGDKVDEFVLV